MNKNSTVQDSLEVDTNPDFEEPLSPAWISQADHRRQEFREYLEKVAQALVDLYFEPNEDNEPKSKCKNKFKI